MLLQLVLLPPLDHKKAIGTRLKTGGLVTFVHSSVDKYWPL